MKNTMVFWSLIPILIIGCGTSEKQASKPTIPKEIREGLTEQEYINGIGPIKSVKTGTINPGLAEMGSKIFSIKCVACHKLDSRLVGPPLEGVTNRRSPEFIMNMILNPEEMVKRHPQVKEMLATYFVPMTFQNVSEQDARAILEYLRLKDKELID